MFQLILFLISEIKFDNLMVLIDVAMILLFYLILFALFADYLNLLS